MQLYFAGKIFLILSLCLPPCRTQCGKFGELETEVADLRAHTPDYIAKIVGPYPARQVLDNRKLRTLSGTCSNEGKTTWRLKVSITVTKGPYNKEHRVIIEVPPSYPETLPAVRFGSKIQSAYLTSLDDTKTHVPTRLLAAELAQNGTTIHGLLTTIHKILTGPLDLETKTVWSRHANQFREESSIARKYKKQRKHKDLFSVANFDVPRFVDTSLQELIGNLSWEDPETARGSLLASGIISEVIPGMVYSFRVFTEAFCKTLMEEVQNFYNTGLPARRPNSMNNYGIILNEIGLEPLMFAMQDEIVQPLAAVLFPQEGSELESHHAFTVRYRGGEDTHLDVHHDSSDVTFNVNIFGDYKGCPLVFCGLVGSPDHRQFNIAYQHRLGYAVIHRGTHRHGAEDITSGERMNLIIWSYSYNFRQSAAHKNKKNKKELGPPHHRCLSYTHDRDYGRFKKYPTGKQQFYGRGWAPPKGYEYEGFVSETA